MNRTSAIIARDFINDRLILAVKLALDKRRAATFSRPAAAPQNALPKTALFPVNMNGRSGSVQRFIEMNSRIGLCYAVYGSLEGSIRLGSDNCRNPIRVGPSLAHCPARQRFGANQDHT